MVLLHQDHSMVPAEGNERCSRPYATHSSSDRSVFYNTLDYIRKKARRAGSDGSMSASCSAAPGFDPRRGSKFSFENFQPWGGDVHFLIARFYITGLD